MQDNENNVIVGNLKGGRILYQICIEDIDVAERALTSQTVELLRNCMELQTQINYHTLAGWGLAFFLALMIVLLMYSQRNKIEILYFSKPVYIPKELQDTLASHDVATMMNGGTRDTPAGSRPDVSITTNDR